MNVGNSTTKCAALGVFWNSGRSGVATNSTQRQLELLRIIEQAGWEYTASFDCAAWRLLYYRDQMACRKATNKPIPKVIQDISDEMNHEGESIVQSVLSDGERNEQRRTRSLQLHTGRWLNMILETASRPDGMLHLQSAHDWSLVRLLMCLASRRQLKASSFPPFCSNLPSNCGPKKPKKVMIFGRQLGTCRRRSNRSTL